MDSRQGQHEQKTRFISAGQIFSNQNMPKRCYWLTPDSLRPKCANSEIWSSVTPKSGRQPPPDRLFWQWSLWELVYHSEAKLSCWKILFKHVSSQTNTQSGWTLTTELINPDVESLTQPSLTLPVRKAHRCLCIYTTCSVFQKRTNLTLFYKREHKDKLMHI